MKPLSVLLAILTLTIASPSLAWNATGHRITGAVAHQDLGQSNRVKVVNILRQFSFYNQWMARKPASMTETEYLFLRATTWPDDIRNTSHDIPRAHFINYRFDPKHPDQNDPLPQTPTNIEASFSERWIQLNDAATNPEDRAIALCWVFHLVGDIHQPLHSTALVNPVFQTGDQGGNLFWVQAGPRGGKVKLHSFWDGLLGAAPDESPEQFLRALTIARDRGASLRQRFKRGNLGELSTTEFTGWSRESLKQAKLVAYDSGKLKGVRGKPGNKAPAVAPDIPQGYTPRALPVAERRAALAGYRLADLIRQLP